jgi:hypothetical protein
VWIPLSARLTPANTAANKVAAVLREALPEETRFVLGNTHYNDEKLREVCLKDQRFLATPKRGAYPHSDAGVEVRRILHLLGYRTIENFNEHFKAIFDVQGAGSHQRKDEHRALRFRGGVRLPARVTSPSRARATTAQRWYETLPQSRLSNCDWASPNWLDRGLPNGVAEDQDGC